MRIDDKCTVYCSFTGSSLPHIFELRNSKGDLYYKRYLNGKTPRIKFNVLHADNYTTNVPTEVLKSTKLELPKNLPDLPPYTRDRVKDVTITYNPDLIGTPARIHTGTGVIERGPRFMEFSKPVRVFFLLHEVGHFYYGITETDLKTAKVIALKQGKEAATKYMKQRIAEEEEKCDLFALVHFLKMGFNRSTAFQALKEVLRRTPENIKRIQTLLNNIQKTQNAQSKAA